VRGRPPGFWIAVAYAASAAGLALDKGFADSIPPYDEPPIAQIGLVAFLLCGAAFVLLCAIAAARAVRRSRARLRKKVFWPTEERRQTEIPPRHWAYIAAAALGLALAYFFLRGR
jgi:Trk-type K+ transport system membrane component